MNDRLLFSVTQFSFETTETAFVIYKEKHFRLPLNQLLNAPTQHFIKNLLELKIEKKKLLKDN